MSLIVPGRMDKLKNSAKQIANVSNKISKTLDSINKLNISAKQIGNVIKIINNQASIKDNFKTQIKRLETKKNKTHYNTSEGKNERNQQHRGNVETRVKNMIKLFGFPNIDSNKLKRMYASINRKGIIDSTIINKLNKIKTIINAKPANKTKIDKIIRDFNQAGAGKRDDLKKGESTRLAKAALNLMIKKLNDVELNDKHLNNLKTNYTNFKIKKYNEYITGQNNKNKMNTINKLTGLKKPLLFFGTKNNYQIKIEAIIKNFRNKTAAAEKAAAEKAAAEKAAAEKAAAENAAAEKAAAEKAAAEKAAAEKAKKAENAKKALTAMIEKLNDVKLTDKQLINTLKTNYTNFKTQKHNEYITVQHNKNKMNKINKLTSTNSKNNSRKILASLRNTVSPDQVKLIMS